MFILSNMLAAGEGAPDDSARAGTGWKQAAAREYPEALQQLALHLRTAPWASGATNARAAQLMREVAHAMKHPATGTDALIGIFTLSSNYR